MNSKIFERTIPEHMKEFKDFGSLNQLIEVDNLSSDVVREAYHDVLLGVLDDSEKTNLHYQIQYLFKEVKVPVNRVLAFLDFKFGSLEELITKAITESPLRNSGLLTNINILTELKYVGTIEAQFSNIVDTSRNETITLEFPDIETTQQRFVAIIKFISQIEKNIEYGDSIKLRTKIVLNPNK